MDIQYFGGNCVALSGKGVRLVVDDFLVELGQKSVVREGDVLLYTSPHATPVVHTKLTIDGPGEFEISDLAIIGVAARAHMDEPMTRNATMYRVMADDVSYLFTGHIYPEISDELLETIGMVDVLFTPVGGNGYTLDAGGVLQLIKTIEPKIVVPTHYADSELRYPVAQQELSQALKNMGMEPTATTNKFRYKPSEVGSGTQLVVLTRS